MNPLLFADWGRMNRLFTKVMWTVAAVMVCIVLGVLVSTGRPTRSPPSARVAGAHSAGAHSGVQAPDAAAAAGTTNPGSSR